MGNDYDYEPYVTPEQERLWNLLEELSSKSQKLITEKRQRAIKNLLEKTHSSAARKKELNDYFSFRMNLEAPILQASDGKSYSFQQVSDIAGSIYDDKTFAYNDASLVLNNLDFFFESITLDDLVLAYHNYRLSADEESLSHFVKLIGYYAIYAFEMDGLRLDFRIPKSILSHEEAMNRFKSILQFVDDYLNTHYEKRNRFSGKYKLDKEARIDFSSRIDRDAAQSFGKKSPLEIRMAKLTRFILEHGDLDDFDEFRLEWILNDLYKQTGLGLNTPKDELSSIQWPTLSDLLALVEKEYERRASKEYEKKSIGHIRNSLISIRKQNLEYVFNQQTAINEDDITDSIKNNSDVETESAFDNIQRSIRFLFFVIMVADEMPEYRNDKETMKRRKSACRKLCDIFSDDCAYETITEEDELNQTEIIEGERIINDKKAELYRTFLMQYDSSPVEVIMENRLALLDKARAIAPEDIVFLEECSAKILDRIQEKISEDSLIRIADNLRATLGTDKGTCIPDNVIHTLATAELLFNRYATEKYAAQDFDYSSISALYYQAFENAYNALIWHDYAQLLNNHTINGMLYTTILDRTRNLYDGYGAFSNAVGFLPSKSYDRHFYVSYRNSQRPRTLVDESCMYMSFGIIMEKICPNSSLPKFCEYFAQKAGFNDVTTMVNDNHFMSACDQFATEIKNSAENRNNASHGGNQIDKNQCTQDKKTVINELEKVRRTNIGLIQQLIFLLNSHDVPSTGTV